MISPFVQVNTLDDIDPPLVRFSLAFEIFTSNATTKRCDKQNIFNYFLSSLIFQHLAKVTFFYQRLLYHLRTFNVKRITQLFKG